MLPRYVRRIIYTLTLLAWLAVIVAAIPHARWMTDDQRALAVLVAALGSLKWLIRRMLAPAHELFCAGKMVGRLETRAELDDSVARLDDRRALRVVTGGPTAGTGTH